MEIRELICIVCPMGCRLRVLIKDDEISVEGNRCPRGYEYAVKEVRAPERPFFTVVKVVGGRYPVVSVRSTKPVPKEAIPKLIEMLSKVVLRAPIESGHVVLRRPMGLDVDIVTTRSVD